jgi:hypothetical protein
MCDGSPVNAAAQCLDIFEVPEIVSRLPATSRQASHHARTPARRKAPAQHRADHAGRSRNEHRRNHRDAELVTIAGRQRMRS